MKITSPRSFKALTVKATELETNVLPPGRYFVGDPTHFLKSDWKWNWMSCLIMMPSILGQAVMLEDEDGHQGAFFSACPSGGNGEYLGSDGVKYGVSSCLFGLVGTTFRTEGYVPENNSRIVDAPYGIRAESMSGYDFHFSILDEAGNTKERISVLTNGSGDFYF